MLASLRAKALAEKPALIVFAILFALAAYLRFDFIYSVTHHVTHDTFYYDIMVRQLLEHGIYGYKSETANAQVPPGYPLFMAAVYELVGYARHDPYPAIRFIQVFVSLVTMLIGVRLAWKLGGRFGGKIGGRTASLVVAAIMAVYPPFIWANGAILTEPLAALLLLIYLYLQLRVLEKPSWKASLLAGAALGLTMLTRSEFSVLLVAAYAYIWIATKNAKTTAKLFMIAALGASVVLSPWIIRNLITLHEPVIASTQVNPFAAGTYPNKNYDDGLVDRQGKTQMQVAKERLKVGFSQHTWTFVKWYTEGKLRAIYSRMFFGAGHAPLYPVMPFRQPFHVSVVLGGLASGLMLLLRRDWRNPTLLLFSLIAVISITRLAFIPEYRYNFTAMPVLIVLDGILAAAIVESLRGRMRRRNNMTLTEDNRHAAP